MTHSVRVDLDLVSIVREIVESGRTEAEWAENESDDMFQRNRWCGGFDADEAAFTFSYYDPSGAEFWCQFKLEQAAKILDGSLQELGAVPANH